MEYPQHLSEKIREELAVSYLKHELRKIFPSIDKKDILGLMNSKELCNPRDFWNGLHGVSMGFKLHIGFIYLVTAENIVWTREKIKIDDLFFGVEREYTKLLGSKSIKKLIEFFKANPKAMNDSKNKLEKSWIDDSEREFDPIIVNEKKDELSIYEGHNRVERFIFEKREIIDAYVGRYKTDIKKPINYWLPTSILMDCLYYVYQAIDNQDENLFESHILFLKDMIKDSESGKYEFTERALTSKEPYRSKILGEFGYLSTADNKPGV